MTTARRLSTRIAALLASVLVAPGASTAPPGAGSAETAPARRAVPQPATVRVPQVSALRRDAAIRVGLTTDRRRVTIGANGSFRVLDPSAGTPVWKPSWRAPLVVGIRGAPPTEGRIYRVQVASFADQAAAETLAAKLRTQTTAPVVVVWVADRKTWRVRVGAADSREGLAAIVTALRAGGYEEIWIGDEPVPQSAPASLVLLDENYDTFPVASKTLRVEPLSGSLLSVDGAVYRGAFEIRLDEAGAVRVVNDLPIESYLRGVVPSELGPVVYPEIEALKAQAVAARTYAYRNLGQYAEQGFDVCDTPRCQVYGGVKAESPLSDRAVRETEGVIAAFGGSPINALYTSTCGGHTEDAEEIFPEEAAPYLVGVPCAPELGARRSLRVDLEGSAALREAPAVEAEAAALLAVHGMIPGSAVRGPSLSESVSEADSSAWIESVGAACGAPATGAGGTAEKTAKDAGGAGAGPTIATLARRIVTRLGWSSRVELLVGREEAASWLPSASVPLAPEEAAAVAYFIRQGGWPAGPRGDPDILRRATRGDLARLLLFASRSCDLLDLKEAIVRGGEQARLKLAGKETGESLAIAPEAYLFADFGSGAVPTPRLGVVAGDRIRYHLDPGGRIDEMLLLPGRRGSYDDRYSGVSVWEVAYGAEELGKKLDAYLGSGSLVDVVPVRRGISGRVTELRISGTAGDTVLKGFNIRTALGLRENLFVVDRQRERSGALKRIVFTGRGWGHGVGMCQVGAYGMALRGESCQGIVTHYYPGVELVELH